MKVLVTGVKGQLGYDVVNELTKRGIEAVGVDIQDMDITDAASVEKVIGEVAPDTVQPILQWMQRKTTWSSAAGSTRMAHRILPMSAKS